MAKKTPIDKLQESIEEILEKYGEEVTLATKEAIQEVTKAGAKAVKANAKGSFGGTGKYASGWKSRYEDGRLEGKGIIYNAALPGLPHLLEFGHAKRGGGRVSGVVHIEPVEREIMDRFEKLLRTKL